LTNRPPVFTNRYCKLVGNELGVRVRREGIGVAGVGAWRIEHNGTCRLLPSGLSGRGPAARFSEQMARAYERQFHTTPQVYACRPSAGAGEVTDSGEF
jgi:hypothetical protein